MPRFPFVKPAAAGFACVIVGAGYRYRLIERQRSELYKKCADISAEIVSLQESRTQSFQRMAEVEKANVEKQEVIDSIWKDRIDRGNDKLVELDSYITALPEAIGVLQGVKNHYEHMTAKMEQFLAFDVLAATAHNLGLLLMCADKEGLDAVSGTIRSLLSQDVLIDSVCTSVENTKSIEAPESIEDASQTFAFCMDQLHDARKKAMERYDAIRVAQAVSASGKPSSDLPLEPSLAPSARGSLLLDVAHHVLRRLRLESSHPSSEVTKAMNRRKAMNALFKEERHCLQTEEDIQEAMDYVESLRSLMNPEVSEELHKKGPSALRSMKDGKEKQHQEDPCALAVLHDSGVQLALQQLNLWRNAVAAFLLQEQAKTALTCYHLLMSECLTRQKHPQQA